MIIETILGSKYVNSANVEQICREGTKIFADTISGKRVLLCDADSVEMAIYVELALVRAWRRGNSSFNIEDGMCSYYRMQSHVLGN